MRVVSVVVTGRVQGVGFRWAAVSEARRAGVDGWVRNRSDGTVEAHLEGAEGAVEAMLTWLRHGPPSAVVDSVESHETAPEGAVGFEVRR